MLEAAGEFMTLRENLKEKKWIPLFEVVVLAGLKKIGSQIPKTHRERERGAMVDEMRC